MENDPDSDADDRIDSFDNLDDRALNFQLVARAEENRNLKNFFSFLSLSFAVGVSATVATLWLAIVLAPVLMPLRVLFMPLRGLAAGLP
jgi:hypothetical protein